MNISKSKGFRVYVCSKHQYKGGVSASFEPKINSVRPSGAEIQNPRPKKWAWPFQGLRLGIFLGSLHFFVYQAINEQKNIGSNVNHDLQP